MDSFFNVDILRDDRGVDELLTGMTLTPVKRSDNNFPDDVSSERSGRHIYIVTQLSNYIFPNICR